MKKVTFRNYRTYLLNKALKSNNLAELRETVNEIKRLSTEQLRDYWFKQFGVPTNIFVYIK